MSFARLSVNLFIAPLRFCPGFRQKLKLLVAENAADSRESRLLPLTGASLRRHGRHKLL